MTTDSLDILSQAHARWADGQFGFGRTPRGALKHLEREAVEALDSPGDITEYADCLLLILDASRCDGFTAAQLIQAAHQKLEVNKSRRWGEPDQDGVVEHSREVGLPAPGR